MASEIEKIDKRLQQIEQMHHSTEKREDRIKIASVLEYALIDAVYTPANQRLTDVRMAMRKFLINCKAEGLDPLQVLDTIKFGKPSGV